MSDWEFIKAFHKNARNSGESEYLSPCIMSWHLEGSEPGSDPRPWPSYTSYQVLGTEVMVGSRPDCFGFEKENSDQVDAFLSVSDRYVDYPRDYRVAWYPWNEGLEAPYSVLFSSLITLHRWIIDEELNKVYIHCCAGTHRAPTVFGAFLWTFFNEKRIEIAENFGNEVRKTWANPNYYFDHHLEINPHSKKFFEYMRNGYDFSKDRNHQSLETILDELDIEDETRRNEHFPSKRELLEELVKEMAKTTFKEVHWTNTTIGKKYYDTFNQLLGGGQ